MRVHTEAFNLVDTHHQAAVTLSRLLNLNTLQLRVDMLPQQPMECTHRLPMADTCIQQIKSLVKDLLLVAPYLSQAATMGILNQLQAMTALRYYLDFGTCYS